MTQNSPPAKGADMKMLVIKVPSRLHKKLSLLKVNRETTLQALVLEALQQFMEAQ